MNKVMVFGVFDRMHPGHMSFLEQARKHGEVIVVITRDAVCHALKGKKPQQHEQIRLLSMRGLGLISGAVLGDEKLGAYEVLNRHKPDIICLGYDQTALQKDLEKRIKLGTIPAVKLVKLKSYYPKRYHTSLL